jgi:hypothetical protein
VRQVFCIVSDDWSHQKHIWYTRYLAVLKKKKKIVFSFVNPNLRQWIFSPTKEILIPVSGSKWRQSNPIQIHVLYLLQCWWAAHVWSASAMIDTSSLMRVSLVYSSLNCASSNLLVSLCLYYLSLSHVSVVYDLNIIIKWESLSYQHLILNERNALNHTLQGHRRTHMRLKPFLPIMQVRETNPFSRNDCEASCKLSCFGQVLKSHWKQFVAGEVFELVWKWWHFGIQRADWAVKQRDLLLWYSCWQVVLPDIEGLSPCQLGDVVLLVLKLTMHFSDN